MGLTSVTQSPFCWAHPRPFGNSISSMIALNGAWWVSTDEGLFESVDHLTWTNRAPEPGPFGPVTSDGSLLITTSERGVFTSATGVTWQRLSTTGFSRVEKRGSRWVGIHYTTGISSSADGITWTVREPSSSFFPVAMTYANGLWIVAGSERPSGGGSLRTSPDGITWTPRPPGGTGEPLLSTIATDGTNVVVIGSDTLNNRRAVFTSTNGTTWSSRTPFHTSSVSSLGFFAGAFFAATSGNGLFTSADGQSWTHVAASPNFALLTHGSLGWLGVTLARANVFSADGLAWSNWRQSLVTITNVSVGALAFADNQFLALIDRTTSTSADGLSWGGVDAGTVTFAQPAFGNGRWVALGGSSLVTRTTGGWSSVSGAPLYPDGVAYGNGTWVCTTSSNAVYTSPDGLAWTQVSNPQLTGSAVSNGSLTFSNGLFIRLRGTMSVSSDGRSWTERAPFGSELVSVTAGQGRWVAIPICFGSGTQSPALTSTDGTTWTPITASPALCGDVVRFGPGGFVMLRSGVAAPFRDSELRLSADGLSWTRTIAVGSPYAISLESGAGRWVLGSAFGAVFASPGAL